MSAKPVPGGFELPSSCKAESAEHKEEIVAFKSDSMPFHGIHADPDSSCSQKFILYWQNESLEERVQKALDCPCVTELRNGPCGTQFSEAFICFLKSTAEEKGSDCVQPFLTLQNCIKENLNAFGDSFLEEDGHKEDSETTDKRKSVG